MSCWLSSFFGAIQSNRLWVICRKKFRITITAAFILVCFLFANYAPINVKPEGGEAG